MNKIVLNTKYLHQNYKGTRVFQLFVERHIQYVVFKSAELSMWSFTSLKSRKDPHVYVYGAGEEGLRALTHH